MVTDPTGRCQNCGKHAATMWFSREGGVLAHIHGCSSAWCECCVLRAQVAHAEERTAALSGLRERLERLDAGECGAVAAAPEPTPLAQPVIVRHVVSSTRDHGPICGCRACSGSF